MDENSGDDSCSALVIDESPPKSQLSDSETAEPQVSTFTRVDVVVSSLVFRQRNLKSQKIQESVITVHQKHLDRQMRLCYLQMNLGSN